MVGFCFQQIKNKNQGKIILYEQPGLVCIQMKRTGNFAMESPFIQKIKFQRKLSIIRLKYEMIPNTYVCLHNYKHTNTPCSVH